MICQPHRWPDAAERQLCVAKRLPARATASAAATMEAAATPVSASACSGVNAAYSCFSASMNASKVGSASGRATVRYSRQLTQRRTNSRSYRSCSSSQRAMARSSAPSVPGRAGSHRSAFAELFDSRGSIVMSVAPCAFASMMRCACGLK